MKNKMPVLSSFFTCCGLAFYLFSQSANAIPPEPPVGKRWVINPDFSDEFNGTALDSSKWFNYHPNWRGRPPALFARSGVSVKDGNLQIKSQPLASPQGRYTMSGGAVVSKKKSAYFGYYEARFIASRLSMSTTFWLSNGNSGVGTPNNQNADCPNDRWTMELDIIEAVGGTFDQPWAEPFRTTHHYNTHQFYTNCSGQKETFSRGSNQATGDGMRIPNKVIANNKEVWEDYNTFAAWWKNENEIDFFLNNIFSGHIDIPTDLFDTPFRRPMSMNLLTETYDWAQPYPTVEELTNDEINTSYYDWVRAYQLLDVLSGEEINLVQNAGFESGDFSNWSGWGSNPREVIMTDARSGDYAARVVGSGAAEYPITLETNTTYTLTAYVNVISGNVFLGAKNNSGNNQNDLGSTNRGDTAGDYQKVSKTFTTGNVAQAKLYMWAQANSEFFLDDVKLTKTAGTGGGGPTGSTIFADNVTLKSSSLDNGVITIDYIYSSDENTKANIIVRDGGTDIKTKTVFLGAGFGHIVDTLDVSALGSLSQPSVEIEMTDIASSDQLSSSGDIIIINNNGFESGDLSNWLSWGGNPVEIASDNVRSGTKAAHIVGAGAVEYPATLQANTTYRLTAYAKVITGQLILGAKNNIASGQPDLGSVLTPDTLDEYKKVEFTFDTAEFTNVKFYMWAEQGSEFYVDDIQLELVSTTP